jgi:hypothetical protein
LKGGAVLRRFTHQQPQRGGEEKAEIIETPGLGGLPMRAKKSGCYPLKTRGLPPTAISELARISLELLPQLTSIGPGSIISSPV